MEKRTPPPWLMYASWAPVLIYFAVKYAVIGRENITSRQSWMLLAAVILAEVALWRYRKSFSPTSEETTNGTDQNG